MFGIHILVALPAEMQFNALFCLTSKGISAMAG
jgi:hypothetical protein